MSNHASSSLCVSGRELTQGHQLGLAGGVSFPVFWLAGAGAAVFWILGEHYFSSLPHCVDMFSLYFLWNHLFSAFRRYDSRYRVSCGISWAGVVWHGGAAHGACINIRLSPLTFQLLTLPCLVFIATYWLYCFEICINELNNIHLLADRPAEISRLTVKVALSQIDSLGKHI